MNSNLETFKDYFKEVSLKHINVNTFQVGSNYNIAEDNSIEYPVVFLELPYTVNYNFTGKKDELQFSFDVFIQSSPDSIKADHKAISDAKEIGDAILNYIYNDPDSPIAIQSSNAISLREFSDDNVSGMRYDLVTLFISSSNCDYTEMFS